MKMLTLILGVWLLILFLVGPARAAVPSEAVGLPSVCALSGTRVHQ